MADLFAQLSRSKGKGFPLDSLDGSMALSTLLEVVGRGAYVALSTSRDGGALSVNVLYDGAQVREWFDDIEILTEWASEVRAAVPERQARAQQTLPTVRGSSKRR